MNSLHAPLAWLLLIGASAPAQSPDQPPPVSDTVPLTSFANVRRTPEELEQLLAPIALYPDALIALLLPASTAPADIVLAARHLRDSGNDRSQVEHRAWDESVKSLTHYPILLTWMDDNLQWTKQVGEAFAEQPADVMQAIQRLRAQARATGTLIDTPQQQIVADSEIIRIVPVQPDTIYVPYYEPSVVFVREPLAWGRPYMTFGMGLPVGAWLAFDFDWRRHTIWVGNRHRRWTGHDWRHPVVPIPVVAPTYARHTDVRPWRPPAPSTRFAHPAPYRPATSSVGFAPLPPPASRTFAANAPAPRPPGMVNHTRRENSPPAPANVARSPSTTLFAPQVVTATGGPRPAGQVVNSPETTTATVPARRGPPDRPTTQGVPTYTHQRHASPGTRTIPSAPPAAAVAPTAPSPRAIPAATRSYPRPAPPAATSPTQPAAAPSPAPAAPPAATTNSTSRPETPPDRGPGRRDPRINER